MDSNVICKIVAWGFRIGNNICSSKLHPIYNFQAGVYIFVDNYRYALGVEKNPRDLAVGVIALFDSLSHLLQ